MERTANGSSQRNHDIDCPNTSLNGESLNEKASSFHDAGGNESETPRLTEGLEINDRRNARLRRTYSSLFGGRDEGHAEAKTKNKTFTAT